MKYLSLITAAAVLSAVLTGAAVAEPVTDPLVTGPHKVVDAPYTLGDEVFTPAGFPAPVEMTGHVYYPERSAANAYPIVVFVHGQHKSCEPADASQAKFGWPCGPQGKPFPNHLGFDYVARALSSHGYAVLSLSANGINAMNWIDSNHGQPARGELVLRHLDLWNLWRTKPGAPIPAAAVRSFDFDRIGLTGHSRGGEGVVNAVDQNAVRDKPFRLRALLPLASTNFQRRVPVGIAMATMQADCDGDVGDLDGVHYYDDGRYHVTGDRAARHNAVVIGANHNFFNSRWSADDTEGIAPESSCHPSKPTRLTAEQQRRVGIAYIGGFFRHYLGGEKGLGPLWRGEVDTPKSVAPATVLVSYHPAAATGQRLDVNRFDSGGSMGSNALGGEVTTSRLDLEFCGGPRMGKADSCLAVPKEEYRDRRAEPHRGWGQLGVFAFRPTWRQAGAAVTNAVPARHGDLRKFTAVRFRAGVDFTDAVNPVGVPQDLSVVLTDTTGKSSAVKVSEFSGGLRYPLAGAEFDVLPRLHLHQIRIPLAAFTGVDLGKIDSVRLAFGVTPTGALVLADLAFTG